MVLLKVQVHVHGGDAREHRWCPAGVRALDGVGPEEQAWHSYINFELRYKEVDRARTIYERYILRTGLPAALLGGCGLAATCSH